VFFDRTVLRSVWSRGPVAPAEDLPAGSVALWPAAGVLCFEIEADAFLRHMVRGLVGTMLEVGRGERSLADFERLLEGAPREAAGPTARAHGLFLWDVRYGAGRAIGPDALPTGETGISHSDEAAGLWENPLGKDKGEQLTRAVDSEA
jgi:hypothetical protein